MRYLLQARNEDDRKRIRFYLLPLVTCGYDRAHPGKGINWNKTSRFDYLVTGVMFSNNLEHDGISIDRNVCVAMRIFQRLFF